MKRDTTSWGAVAQWYDDHLQGDDTYHARVIAPSFVRLVGDGVGKKALDIACGEGYFTRILSQQGYTTTGCDIASELIERAKKTGKEQFVVAPAEKLPFLDSSFDLATCVLALQNIRDIQSAFSEASRVLAPGGRCICIINHPSFRIPQRSSWGFDESTQVQYRRLDGYMSESKVDIVMNPGQRNSASTPSFHRPLQVYIKALAKSGFAVIGMEEWMSHKESEKGPKKEPEDKARKEFPLFLCIVAKKQ